MKKRFIRKLAKRILLTTLFIVITKPSLLWAQDTDEDFGYVTYTDSVPENVNYRTPLRAKRKVTPGNQQRTVKSRQGKLIALYNDNYFMTLSKLGWQVQAYDKEIVCDSTDALGYGTIYKDYIFNIADAISHTIDTNHINWKYEVFNAEDSLYTTVTEFSGDTFCLSPSVVNSSLDGFQCVQARVCATLNGSDYYFPLTLDAKPYIKDITVHNVSRTSNTRYELDLDIAQNGATNGTIYISDNSGSVRVFPYNGNTIHVTNLLIGYNLYLDVNMENQYGTSFRFVTGEFYNELNAHEETLVAEESDKGHSTLNNEKKILTDGDSVLLDIPITENVDSVIWFLNIDNRYRKICVLYPDSNPYYFTVSPKSLDCSFTKEDNSGKHVCWGNSSWALDTDGKSIGNMTVWNTTGQCLFTGKVYYHTNSENKTRLFTLPVTYQLDVLPSSPVLEVIDIWAAEEDPSLPYARIRFHNMENFDYAIVSLLETGTPDPFITNDTVFMSDFKDDYVILMTWTSHVFCTAKNAYGFMEGPHLTLDPTGIESHKWQSPAISVNRNTLEVKGEGWYNITVCSIDGTKVYSCRVKDSTAIKLNPGNYIVNVQNTNNKSLTKKIFVENASLKMK